MSESNIQASPGSIFICYRREDSADVTGRIYDRLVDRFGRERVFMDLEAIRLGYDFRSEIDQMIKACSIVIVVIGDKWLTEVDGERRIGDENDPVRIEIETALRREIPIIPVLTGGASHPTKAMLPASLEALAYRNGTSIRREHFREDMDSLISRMDKLLARQESIWTRKRRIIVTAVGAIVMLLLAISALLTRPHSRIGSQKSTDQGNAAAQCSTNVDKPTLLTSNEIRGKGVGEVVSCYYTFTAGPGDVTVTVDGKNTTPRGEAPHENVAGLTNAIAVEISDLDAKKLLRVNLGYTQIDRREVERFQLHRRQQVILRILLSRDTLDYMVRVEGPIDFSPSTKPQR
jgi:TIR domain